MRRTYQQGWLELQSRKSVPSVWLLRFRERLPNGKLKKSHLLVGTKDRYPTEVQAKKAAEQLRLSINVDNLNGRSFTFGLLVDRYIAEELPDLRHSTADSYRSYLHRHIRPKWSEYPITRVRAFAVEQWIKSLEMAPKSKGHLHNLMRVLFNCAMRWELIELGENPMKLVRVRGVSKRCREPKVLSIEQCHRLLKAIPNEPFHTMVFLDMATGLRCSELLALKWCDFDWENLTLQVQRAVVDGVVDQVKTRYSQAGLPLDPELAELMWRWKSRAEFNGPDHWVFASPFKGGEMPYRAWGVQQRHIKPAAETADLGNVGWHTFRHTFSSLLRANREDIKVQQELLRHADIRTTMNVYTQAVSDQKRLAHGRIVRLLGQESA